jgi:hypothetical protein
LVSDLQFESNFEDPAKVSRIKNFLAQEIETAIHLFGVFSVGYVDIRNKYISVSDFEERKREFLADGIGIPLKYEKLKDQLRSITYRKMVFSISLNLYEWLLKIDDVSENIDRLIIHETDAVPTLQGPRHKLVLLKELGVLEFLFQAYKNDSPMSKFAQLVALMLGLTSKNDVETIRKECQLILHDSKSSGKGGKAINNESVKAVTFALKRIGYPTKNISLLD